MGLRAHLGIDYHFGAVCRSLDALSWLYVRIPYVRCACDALHRDTAMLYVPPSAHYYGGWFALYGTSIVSLLGLRLH